MITRLRRQKGLSQRQLAHAVGCSHVTIGNYERGRIYPSLPRARRLASILGSTIEELFTECPDAEETSDDDAHAVCTPISMGS